MQSSSDYVNLVIKKRDIFNDLYGLGKPYSFVIFIACYYGSLVQRNQKWLQKVLYCLNNTSQVN